MRSSKYNIRYGHQFVHPFASVLYSRFAQVLRTFEYDFTVRQIELNEAGKMLAVAGDHDVFVVILPIAFKGAKDLTAIKCK